MATIDNKCKGISVDPLFSESESMIEIRGSYNPLMLGRPVIVVECGDCGATYKKNLFFQTDYFCVENEQLLCKCGHKDTITYRSSPL
jgi:hypothetical protein